MIASLLLWKDKIYTNLDYKDKKRWAKKCLLGDTDKVSTYNISEINYLLNNLDYGLIINPISINNNYNFRFEDVLQSISLNNIEKIRYYIDKPLDMCHYGISIMRHPSNTWKPEISLIESIENEYKQRLGANLEGKAYNKQRDIWYTMMFITWTMLHNIPDKERIYEKHHNSIRRLYFKIRPFWTYDIETTSELFDGDKVSNISDYTIKTFRTNGIKHLTDWLWGITVGSEYRILPFNINHVCECVLLINNSLDIKEAISKINLSIEKQRTT